MTSSSLPVCFRQTPFHLRYWRHFNGWSLTQYLCLMINLCCANVFPTIGQFHVHHSLKMILLLLWQYKSSKSNITDYWFTVNGVKFDNFIIDWKFKYISLIIKYRVCQKKVTKVVGYNFACVWSFLMKFWYVIGMAGFNGGCGGCTPPWEKFAPPWEGCTTPVIICTPMEKCKK